MNDSLKLKTIEELKKFKFLIPSYQRGYRWTSKEVLELLNDIDSFNPIDIDDEGNKSWYCLQPIVLKENGKYFEVIDGQQRLTTIYLILHYLNQLIIKKRRTPIFELDYETRKMVPEFLNSLEEDKKNHDNIDFYYISNAYETICKWFDREQFDIFNFQSKFNFNTKVIWYESNEEDSITIFTRINVGKIPLTNAELIKALFLNSSNFDKNYNEKVRLKQLEIASEWDRIEHSLHNDSFWYFISRETLLSNRIDYIFRLMNSEDNSSDSYSTFRFFNKKFENKSKDVIENNWLEVKNYFQTLEEWYSERGLYHKIGYLVCEGENLENLVNESLTKKKDEFQAYLDSLIRKKMKNVNIDELQYGDKKLKTVLLLYNIQTMLMNDSINSRFPFDLYKKENWDIEHITSVKDTRPEQITHKKMWLTDAYSFIEDEELRIKVSSCDIEENFETVFDDVINHFNNNVMESDINDISNLTLLDSEINRGYKNAVFPVKRMTIIQKEKEGRFIPICTKNAFLKYFSEYPPKMSFWTQEDKNKYFDDIVRVLRDYL